MDEKLIIYLVLQVSLVVFKDGLYRNDKDRILSPSYRCMPMTHERPLSHF